MVVDDVINPPALRMTDVKRRPDAATPVELSRPGAPAELADALAAHVPVLLAAARALVRNEADARDLVQTTLEIATRKSGDLRDPAALRPWLLTIQVRQAFRLRRQLSRMIHLTPEIADVTTIPGPDTDAIAVRTALTRLPTRARSAVVLHYLAGLSVAEVARAMSISENTTKGHLKLALARLREEFKDD
jgi:RNA polymerase sigma-70 factor (ECF subfamily)